MHILFKKKNHYDDQTKRIWRCHQFFILWFKNV